MKDYVDPFSTKESLHFQWKQTAAEEEFSVAPGLSLLSAGARCSKRSTKNKT